MLLSPSNAKSWAPRVRRIIFDEIHSIGQAEDGVVWEQLLLQAPCPIIALSATIGNPKQFNEWLSETQTWLGSDMQMIEHSTRYSDLRKYMYKPPKVFKFAGLGKSYGVGLGLDGLEGISVLHPVASLAYRSQGIPNDLALEPRDCLTLCKAMCKFQNASYTVPESLNPEKALPASIRKMDIFDWEKRLKELLLNWMQDNQSPFDQVVHALNHSEMPQPINTASSPSSLADAKTIDPYDLTSTTLPLLYQLHKRRALPAIFFNYDRSQCEDIAEAVLNQLVEAELAWKKTPAWKKMIEGYEKWKDQKLKKPRKPAKPIKKSKGDEDEGGSKLDRMRDDSGDGASIYDLFDPDAPQDGFSFANYKQIQKSELNEYINALRWKNVSNMLIDSLMRGIGVHHNGMNRKYRQCVEILFRKGFLQVVIATGTLSLGINMPCSTVVFSGDSVFLNALNFRQASGRAGRRGFDLLGNVVFQGLPKERACSLLSSRLPEFTGHFSITTTFVLRLFMLLDGSNNSEYAKRVINSILSQSRLYLGGQSFKEQIMHHLRFSIDYLRRNGLLGPSGEPINFSGCITRLFYTENSSFAFHGGYFQSLCSDGKYTSDAKLLEIMLTLSHLFGRKVCKKSDDPIMVEAIKRSSSEVYLPELPEPAAEILRKHNQEILEIFESYVKTFSSQHIKEEENKLPLTNLLIGGTHSMKNEGKSSEDAVDSKIGEGGPDMPFLPFLPTPKIRSPFFALSGLGDDFQSVQDLCSSTRRGIFLESAVIPHLRIYPDGSGVFLNAYLFDFFKHGNIEVIESANSIHKSDIWFLLNDFSLILTTIVTSIANYLGLRGNNDLDMLDVMGSGDAAENENDEQIAGASVIEPTVTGPTAIPPSQQRFVPKKKVYENWDAGEDAFTEEESLKNKEARGIDETNDAEYGDLINVYSAFKKLREKFDEKFTKMWA